MSDGTWDGMPDGPKNRDVHSECREIQAQQVKRIAELEKSLSLFSASDEAALFTNIARTWNRERIGRFCLHLLGDEWQQIKAERDRMREQEKYWHETAQGLGVKCFDAEKNLAAAVALLERAARAFDYADFLPRVEARVSNETILSFKRTAKELQGEIRKFLATLNEGKGRG